MPLLKVEGGSIRFKEDIRKLVHEYLVTTAARDQQLVPTTRSKDFFLNIAGNPTDFCLLTFFFLICIFYLKILQETPRTSVSSRFFL